MRELRRLTILRTASAFFAAAEVDRKLKGTTAVLVDYNAIPLNLEDAKSRAPRLRRPASPGARVAAFL
ncbi:hypothetical protein [Nocardioides rubriscoriae]|uniref:hypothetical protein n=1 Tax=Nocardioides rubriscoriae TaxID=642762 RepID=UPI0011DFF903|nr:hypothetical protein [Nocardioides rubriscoriae]